MEEDGSQDGEPQPVGGTLSQMKPMLGALCAAVLISVAADAAAQSGDPHVPDGYGAPAGTTQPPPPPSSDPYATQPQPAQPIDPAQPMYPAPAGAGAGPGAGPGVYPVREPPPPRELRSVSLTISPVHLLFPIVELTGDIRVLEKLSIAAILGFGTVQLSGSFADERATVFEAGTQIKFYPVGDFDHAMQLGVEVLYIHVSATLDASGVTGTGSGLALGPFIGYKWIASFGLTIDVQVGAQIAGIFAEASDGTTTEEDSTTELIPLLNLNFGWSF